MKDVILSSDQNLLDNLKNIVLTAQGNAFRKVNEELIGMYWQIGKKLSEEKALADFGDAFVTEVSKYIQSIYNQLLLNILRVISQKYGHNL